MENDQKQPGETPEAQENPMLRDPMQPQQPAPSAQPPARKVGRSKIVLFVVIGLIGLALIAVGIYWLVLRNGDKQPASQQTNTSTSAGQEQEEEMPESTLPDSTPVVFKSEKLNIELTHRKDWTLKESSDGAITITSPRITYRTSDNTSKTGVFTMRIRKGASEAQKNTIDKSIATRDSEVIAYAAPVEGQRQYTNLSFVGPKDMFGFFIVTGNTEFKAGEPLMYALPLDGEFYLIVGGYGADSSNSLAFDPVPKDAIDSATLEQAIDIVESLKIY